LGGLVSEGEWRARCLGRRPVLGNALQSVARRRLVEQRVGTASSPLRRSDGEVQLAQGVLVQGRLSMGRYRGAASVGGVGWRSAELGLWWSYVVHGIRVTRGSSSRVGLPSPSRCRPPRASRARYSRLLELGGSSLVFTTGKRLSVIAVDKAVQLAVSSADEARDDVPGRCRAETDTRPAAGSAISSREASV